MIEMRINLRSEERLDDLLIDNLKLIQNPNYFCFSLDAVLLSDFIRPRNNSRVLDIGTGNGIIPHLIEPKYKVKEVIGIDIQKQVIDMAKRSSVYNNLQNKLTFINLDLKDALKEFGTESFDYIVSNPPYMKRGSGKVNPENSLAIARHEIFCELEDIIKVSSQLLKYKAKVAYVYRTQRLAELLSLLEKYNLSAKRMRLIYPQLDKKSNLVLIEAIKGGGVGLDVLSPLIVYNKAGDYSEEVKKIYYPES
ncbi:tRNA1(Val) (adenine(37)-N6)-methyltransferase [Orenia marismortui]|uniref:tRNA1(Val) A37 N6-methylase TrmN6 n=1 Tax=Orenia marismortui TaxID=46469 RepID=A0A4R8H0F6_9FIRM|nr:tRNA1(Val) (adenine(37)-N6)-methyltransferase [Orenia marismortui]TDX51303.1 tRNA1(Val) A37 N6-methylase TrmN6 [Orenia marismortui]